MLKFLGTGGAFNVKDGNTSAYFEIGSELFLIDVGEDVFQKLIKKKILENKSKVNIFITHLHSDHIGSLGTLIAYLYFKQFACDNGQICVYFPSQSLQELLLLNGVSKEWYMYFVNRWDELYVDLNSKRLEYQFNEVKHTELLNYKKANNCYSIEFSLKNSFSFYYSGDTCEFEDKALNTYAYDKVYHEVTNTREAKVHTTMEYLKEKTKDLPEMEKKKITLMHYDEDFDCQQAINEGYSVAIAEL